MKTSLSTRFGTAAALVLLLAGCAGGPASGSGASIVEDRDSVETVTETEVAAAAEEVVQEETPDEIDADDSAQEAALGTRDNPLPVGTRIEMGGWTLAVTDVKLDATDQVMTENEFNDPPVDGRQFAMFTVDATYEGADSGTAWLDFSWAIVGAAGNTFGTGNDDYCGVIPGPLDDTGETFPGGRVSGNVCVSVPSDQLEGGTILIEESMTLEDTRAFYAVP